MRTQHGFSMIGQHILNPKGVGAHAQAEQHPEA
jgi:hypothetical protein